MSGQRDCRTAGGRPKARFPDAGTAGRVLEKMISKRGHDPLSRNIYECPRCGWWHIGRVPGFARKRP
jgi:hypothetical protein